MTEAWLITGGAGFIGTNFVRSLYDQVGVRLVVLDDLTYAGNFRNIEELVTGGAIDFYKGSISDTDTVAQVFESADITKVINFAAESHVDRSISGPQAFIETNVNGTFVLLAAAKKAWSGNEEGRVFLHVSTDEVYGDLEPDEEPKDEASAYRPSSPYSASKAASDHLCRAWYRTFSLPVIITNCSNNYGPYQFPEKLIPLMINQAKKKEPLPIYGDGQQIRDWLYVEDHCAALDAVLRNGSPGETYCIGSGTERTNLEVVKLICELVDQELGRPRGTSADLITQVDDRPGHDRRYALNATKLAEEFDWSPTVSFDEGLRETVRWYLAHEEWLEQITSGDYRQYFARQYHSSQFVGHSGDAR